MNFYEATAAAATKKTERSKKRNSREAQFYIYCFMDLMSWIYMA